MSTHTPGPWTVFANREDPYDSISICHQSGSHIRDIAEVSSARDIPGLLTGDWDKAGDEAAANAHLIAAAPDLLAACRRLVDLHESDLMPVPDFLNRLEILAGEIKRIIANAEQTAIDADLRMPADAD